MNAAVRTVDMNMRVNVRVFMRVDRVSMRMFVRVRVRMFVRMLQFDGVPDHQTGTEDHHGQRSIKLDRRSFS